MNRFANALIGAAAANVAAHEVVDIGVGGFRLLAKQRHGRHDLPGLTITALRNVLFHPSLLYRMASVRGQPFDCRDFLSRHRRYRCDAGASRLAINVNCTRATKRHATAEFCAGQVQRVPENPEQRHLWINFDGLGFSIQGKGDSHKTSRERNLASTGYPTPTSVLVKNE